MTDREGKILKEALTMACEKLKDDHPVLTSFGFDLVKYYIDKATDVVDARERCNAGREEW